MTRRLAYGLMKLLASFVLLITLLAVGLWGWSQARETQSRLSAAPSAGTFVDAADVQLYVQQAGPAQGTPVVLIGGMGAWSETWRPTINALAAEGYRVIAPDLPPFGFSFRPTSDDYSTEAQAKRILGVLDTLGITSAIFVGHSFGARATVQAAMSAPQRVHALVLVAPALGLQTLPDKPQSAWVRTVLDTAPLRNVAVASLATPPLMARTFLKAFTIKHAALTDERVAVYQRPLYVAGTTEATGHWLRQFLLSTEQPASGQVERYRDLNLPLLLIWGEQDSVTPLSQAQHLLSVTRGATLKTLPGIGHIPQLEDNAAFNALLLAHLPTASHPKSGR